jgi:hypothetical protein
MTSETPQDLDVPDEEDWDEDLDDSEGIWDGEQVWASRAGEGDRSLPPTMRTEDPRTVGRFLLSQLPLGGLTMFELSDAELTGNWVRTVMGLAVAAVESGRAVLYTQCGGWDDTAAADELRAATGSSRFAVSEDCDVSVRVPRHPASLERVRTVSEGFYLCGVPTLRAIEVDLVIHECTHGPALVVLDQIDQARPWSVLTLGDDLWALPPWTLTAPEADAWRAHDLHQFAEQRPDAPTLVVSDSPLGREAIRDRALMVIRSVYAVGEAESLTVEDRSSIVEPWSEAVALVLPQRERAAPDSNEDQRCATGLR